MNERQKRAACDECHRRKRACTKDAESCSRCLSSGLQCVYSLSKPMGRPGRRLPEESGEAEQRNIMPYHDDQPVLHATLDPVPALDNFQLDGTQQGFVDYGAAYDPVSFLDDVTWPQTVGNVWTQSLMTEGGVQQTAAKPASVFQLSMAGLDIMDKVDFALSSSQNERKSTQSSQTTSSSSESYSESCSVHSPLSKATDESPSCDCLYKLFYGFSTLTGKVTGPVNEAFRRIRTPTRLVHETVLCRNCNLTFTPQPGESSAFQTSWAIHLLCTKIIVVINAYASALELVETTYAEADTLTLPFSLTNLGGLWGQLSIDSDRCVMYYNDHEMAPAMWRTTMRALLRTDLQGFDMVKRDGEKETPYHHPGIVDHLDRLEKRCRDLSEASSGQTDDSGKELAEKGLVADSLRMIGRARSAILETGLT